MKPVKAPDTALSAHTDIQGFKRRPFYVPHSSKDAVLTENQKQVTLTFRRALADWLQAHKRDE
jgi:hypothetical protein